MAGGNPDPGGYEPRVYRDALAGPGVRSWNITYHETDLWISADRDLKTESITILRRVRDTLDRYCRDHTGFTESLEPVPVGPDDPEIVRIMAAAGHAARTGPMAAVAGAVAAAAGAALSRQCGRIIVENGGDLYLHGAGPARVEVLVRPQNPFYRKLYIQAPESPAGYGICTSSGLIGHSHSRGRAEAVVVQAPDAALADAAATAIANLISRPADMDGALASGSAITGVEGILAVSENRIGAWGNIRLLD